MAKRKNKKKSSQSKQNTTSKRRSLGRSVSSTEQEQVAKPLEQAIVTNPEINKKNVFTETKPEKKKLTKLRLII